MSESERGQVTRSAADIYNAFFVPALFSEWAPRVARAAEITPGQHVLNVGCGTGVLARHAATLAGARGRVVGLDVNPGMLAVAARARPALEWRQGEAESLPFTDGEFNAVVCQFALMFLGDRKAALEEMARVTRRGGRLALAVWAGLDDNPGYTAVARLLHALFGPAAAAAVEAPFALGDVAALRARFADAGLPDVRIETVTGAARFPSIESWMHTEIRGWTLADRIDDAQFAALLAAAHTELQPFCRPDGRVAFAMPAHIVSATL